MTMPLWICRMATWILVSTNATSRSIRAPGTWLTSNLSQFLITTITIRRKSSPSHSRTSKTLLWRQDSTWINKKHSSRMLGMLVMLWIRKTGLRQLEGRTTGGTCLILRSSHCQAFSRFADVTRCLWRLFSEQIKGSIDLKTICLTTASTQPYNSSRESTL